MLENHRSVNSEWYTTVALPKVFQALRERRPKTGLRGIMLHHDNASSHTSLRTKAFLEESGVETLPHPPYSPDLAPCDFFLFPIIKEKIKGNFFRVPKRPWPPTKSQFRTYRIKTGKSVLIVGLGEWNFA